MGEQFRTLSPTVCKVIEAIWRLEIELETEGRGPTKKEILEMLNITDGHLAKILSQIQRMPVQYLIKMSNNSEVVTKKGSPHKTYRPNHDNLTTDPKTAVILLELLRFPRVEIYYVVRRAFAKYLSNKFGFTSSFIRKKLDWAISVSYVSEDRDRGYITPHLRIGCEKRWLDLIAAEYGK